MTGIAGTGAGGGGIVVDIPEPGLGPVVPNDDPTNPTITHPKCNVAECTDFPEQPILGEGVPPNAPELFGDPEAFSPGSLCVLEPQLSSSSANGTMIPANWVRPRFRFAGGTGLDLYEIRVKTPAQKHELVVYTKQTTWYMPKEIWAGTGVPGTDDVSASGNGAANNSAGAPFTVTVRGVNTASPGTPVGVRGDFHVAPVVATGSMVFWTVNSSVVTPDSSKLLGFAVGDEGVAETVTLQNVQWTGQIGENGATLRGYYDDPKLPGFTNGQVRCIGCHVSTPDGAAVIFTDDWPWSKAVASVAAGSVGQVPAFITPGARALLKLPWLGTQTMTKAHWMPGDRILVTSYGIRTANGAARDKPWFAPNYDAMDEVNFHQLAWIDLETPAVINDALLAEEEYGTPALDARQTAAATAQGTAWGLIPTGDPPTVSAVLPSFNRAGDKIAYVTTDASPNGHPHYTATSADVKVVPYNNRMGGTGQPLAGASDPNFLEYYPSYSADDKLIAFTRSKARNASSPDGPYYNRFGEIMVVPAEGAAAALRLAANDPNACAGDNVQRGIINSWPKWSPDAFSAHGKTYYFLIFSSARKYGDEFAEQFQIPPSAASGFTGLTDSSQLWLASIVVDNATGEVWTFPALYIWNQNRLAAGGMGTNIQFSNLTPAWDPFQLPPIIIPDVPTEPPPR